MKRQLLFHRDFREYTGGHGKVWDYFRHASKHPAWQASIFLTAASVEQHNPWRGESILAQPSWAPERASALFLGGLDWSTYPHDDPAKPVINLVQHVRHADPDSPLHPHLSRRAIRICVSQAVAEAIAGTGLVNGPVRVIPAALDLAALPRPAELRSGIFVGATKQPALGQALCERLRALGYEVALVDRWLPRADYLERLARCRVAVLLPMATEGFYLPGLEAMALGCATVVPDCIGNREYLQPGSNALSPVAELDALVAAVISLDTPDQSAGLAAAGTATAAGFTLERERLAFHAILDQLEPLWTS